MAIVSVDEIKPYLKIEHNEEDDLLADLIEQGQAAAEDFCRVTFNDEDAPAPVKLAVILFVSHYYENRDNTDRHVYQTARTAFENLLYPYRDPTLMF